MVSATTSQPLMATASTSHHDIFGKLRQTISLKFQKALPQASQNSNSSSGSTDGPSVHFIGPGQNRQSGNTNQN